MGARYATKLEPDVLEVLNRSIISDKSLTLPPGQLDRALYVKVDKVLKAAGGKWNRSAKAHLFPNDPRAALGIAMQSGEIVDSRKRLQQFFTPAKLASFVCELANIQRGMHVLEPSAGRGALAVTASVECGAIVTCVEVDPKLAEELKSLGFQVHPLDFLSITPTPGFDRVVMNPPFADGQDADHIAHAIRFLKPGGRLVAIAGAGIKSNEWKKTRDFRALIDSYGGTIEDLPEGSFEESGTSVRTVVVVVDIP